MAAAEASVVAEKLSAEQRLWKRLCRYHFSPMQIDFALSEAQKDKEKPPQMSKVNRNIRSAHPYLNSPRSSPVRTLDNDFQRKQVPTNATSCNPYNFSILKEQTLQECSSGNQPCECEERNNNKRLVSFQDVRNHIDRQESWNNARCKQTVSKKKEKEERAADKNNCDIDWEDIFHRARR